MGIGIEIGIKIEITFELEWGAGLLRKYSQIILTSF